MKNLISKSLSACVLSIMALSMMSATSAPPEENPGDVRVVPVLRTPEADNVKTDIYFPGKGELVSEMPVNVQIKINGYPMGVNSDFKRQKELPNIEKGQSLRVLIDNDKYFDYSKEVIQDTMKEQPLYFVQILDVDLNLDLTPGEHILRAYLVRSYGESLKGYETCDAVSFFYKDKTPVMNVNLKAPYLTYNEPRGTYKASAGEPVLLDFLIENCRLSQDGYKVRLTIDNDTKRILTRWIPYYLYGLSKGQHTIRLELLDDNNNLVEGAFNDVSHEITVE